MCVWGGGGGEGPCELTLWTLSRTFGEWFQVLSIPSSLYLVTCYKLTLT